jgi:hypothetical protein
MLDPNLGATIFTFTGVDRPTILITYFTGIYIPDPPGGGGPGLEVPPAKFESQGIEGDHTFFGDDIKLQESPLGTLVTVTLQPIPDIGVITLTVLIPHISGATEEHAVTFETQAIEVRRRGFIQPQPGADLVYTTYFLQGTAKTGLPS